MASKAPKPRGAATAISGSASIPIDPAATSVAAAAPEGTSSMDATTTTAQAKTMFAEVTERAKTGFAKSQTMFADIGDFGKGNLEAMVESSKIAARGFETLGQNAAAFARSQFEDAQAQARTLAGVTSPTEFFKLQGDFARASFDKIVAEASRGTEAMVKLATEVAQPISNRVALAADKMKVAA